MFKPKYIMMIVLIGVSFLAVYWFYLASANDFPSNDAVLEEINAAFSEARANEVQDVIKLDNRNVFVPFKTGTDGYAISFWIWKHHKWNLGMIELAGEPRMLKIKSTDPSSYHIVWNIHPEDRIDQLSFYLMKKRNYMVSEGKHRYDPRIQLNERVPLANQAYGALPLPKKWITLLEEVEDVQDQISPTRFDHFLQQDGFFFGWLPKDQNGSVKYPERSLNGNGWSNGDVEVDFLMILQEADLQD